MLPLFCARWLTDDHEESIELMGDEDLDPDQQETKDMLTTLMTFV